MSFASAVSERPVIRRWLRKLSPPILTSEQTAAWERDGYLVLPGHFSNAAIDRVNAEVDAVWQDGQKQQRETVMDIFIGTPDERRIHLRDAPAAARQKPYKLNDLYLESPVIRDVILEERLSLILEDLLDGAPLVCNSLNLEFGSQQPDHTDSLYMPAPVGLHLVASWIALEDGNSDSGPLRYYPGSHKIPPYRFSDNRLNAISDEMPEYNAYMRVELERRKIRPEFFVPRLGDVFIWHSQLLHGGEPIKDLSLTRRSLVTHYWRAEDVRGRHGHVGQHRYYLRRAPQPVPTR